MCGILFVFSNKKRIDQKLFSDSIHTLSHRGPDSKEVRVDGNCIFGFTRLAIQDLSSNANQPMIDDNGNILIFNGEIYNFKEIRQALEGESHNITFNTSSDTEVLLRAIGHWGIKRTLSELSGMFSFVYKDSKESIVYAARDHFGMKPLHFSYSDNLIVIGSEIKSILPFIDNKEIDNNNSLNPIFFTGLSPNGKTMFKGINRLMPGELLSFDMEANKYQIAKYFDCSDLVDKSLYEKISKMDEDQYVDLIKSELEKSVEMHSVSDARLGILFSAGLDSSIIAAILASKNTGKVDLFKYQSDSLNDNKLAIDFKNKFNCNLHTIDKIDDDIIYELPRLIYYYETINKADGSPLGMCCKFAREKGFKVLLAGDSADEIFGGYQSFSAYIMKKKIQNLKFFSSVKKIINKIIPGFSDLMGAELDYIVSPYSTELLETYLDASLHGGMRKADFCRAVDSYRFIENSTERDINAFLLDEISHRLERFLIRNDRYGMMESIEMRVPFLTLAIVKIAVNTPYYLKSKLLPSLRGRSLYSQKYSLKKVAEKLKVTKNIIYRPKIGTPIGGRNNFLQELIFNRWSLINIAKFFEMDESNLKKMVNCASSKSEKNRLVWNFLSLEILIRIFINQENYEYIQNEFRSLTRV